MNCERFDVVIAGAGLVGLALAPALARAGLSVALVDRAPINAPEYDPASFDPRVYAISPGSAAFLRALGAWQLLPCDRVTPIEAMRVVGDAGATLSFSAYDLHERALAWIVEERVLRAALLRRVFDAGVTVIGGTPLVGLAWTADEGTLTLGQPGDPPRSFRGAVDGGRLRSPAP